MRSMTHARSSLFTSRRTATQAGFTLVEVVVAAAILLLLLGFLFFPTLTAFNLFSQTQAKSEAQANTRFAMEQMTREIREAVTMYVYEASVDYDGDGTAETYQRISFQLPSRSYNTPLLMYQIDTPLRPAAEWITYYVRPANKNAGGMKYDADTNPLALFRAVSDTSISTAMPGVTVPDLEPTSAVHTGVTSIEDDDIERLGFDMLPAPTANDLPVESVSIDLRLRRAEYSGTAIESPRGHLKNVIQPPHAVVKRP